MHPASDLGHEQFALKVFLCHSAADKPVVRDLYRRLAAVGGLSPWLDELSLLPGQNWQYEIRRAVRASHAVIVCLSGAATTKRGFLHTEIKLALDTADEQPEGVIYLIPVLLEPCEIPERLRHLHHVRLFEPDGFRRLLFALHTRAAEVGLSLDLPVPQSVAALIQALADRLSDRQWREADQLTAVIMLAVADRDKEGCLSPDDFQRFPCSIIMEIDRLWREVSDGRFGFSIQALIWGELGGLPPGDETINRRFGVKLGWEQEQTHRWLRWGELSFSLDAPPGHLPTPPRWWELWERFRVGEEHLYYRLQKCGST